MNFIKNLIYFSDAKSNLDTNQWLHIAYKHKNPWALGVRKGKVYWSLHTNPIPYCTVTKYFRQHQYCSFYNSLGLITVQRP